MKQESSTRFAEKTVYCNNCGAQFKTTFSTMCDYLSKSRVCSVGCLDQIQRKYTRCILNKPEPMEVQNETNS